eukprot:2494457-Pyramimonas_sp.AAC.1
MGGEGVAGGATGLSHCWRQPPPFLLELQPVLLLEHPPPVRGWAEVRPLLAEDRAVLLPHEVGQQAHVVDLPAGGGRHDILVGAPATGVLGRDSQD